jgi:hypothetical protein
VVRRWIAKRQNPKTGQHRVFSCGAALDSIGFSAVVRRWTAKRQNPKTGLHRVFSCGAALDNKEAKP